MTDWMEIDARLTALEAKAQEQQDQIDAMKDRITICECCGGRDGEHYPNCLDFPPAKTEQEQSISPGDYISTSAGSRELRIHNTGEQTIHVAFDAEPEQEQEGLDPQARAILMDNLDDLYLGAAGQEQQDGQQYSDLALGLRDTAQSCGEINAFMLNRAEHVVQQAIAAGITPDTSPDTLAAMARLGWMRKGGLEMLAAMKGQVPQDLYYWMRDLLGEGNDPHMPDM